MNSALGPLFNTFFFLKKVLVGPVNSGLCLLHSESMCMNGAATIHTCWKKKKKKKANVKLKTQTRNMPIPNGHVVMLIFVMEIVVLIYYQI